MKIMFVIPRMNCGGAERVVANLSDYFCKNNNVRIVTLVDDKSYYKLDKKVEFCSKNLTINRKNIFTTIGCYSKFFLKAKRYIKKNVEEFKPDYVISFLVETDILTYLATRKNRKVIKVFSERNDPTRRSILKRLLLKRVYKSADLFVCQSQKIADYYDYVPAEKKKVIANPLDVKVLPKIVAKERNHNIVAVGRLRGQKNFSLLIKSFAKSVERLPDDCKLLIYGEGPLKKELQSEIKTLNLENKIKLMGTSKNVLDEIKDAALFVLSSDYEGFPNVLLEAMAMGLPVISTDFYTGVANEIVKKKNGMVVPVGDIEKMSKAMIKIMNDEKSRVNMRNENSKIRKNYSIEIIAPKWIKKNQPKTVLFISSLSGGGAERVTVNLANFLSRNGHSVDVITMSNKKDTYKLDGGVRRISLLDEKERKFGKIRNFWKRQKRLKEYVMNNRDVFCYIVMLPMTTFMLARLKKFTNGKLIISERINPKSYNLIKKMMMKYAAKRADGLVVQTKEIADWYENIEQKIIIPNAINEDIDFSGRKRVEKKFVAVGRITKQKNYPMMIEAFKEFLKKHPEYALEIYGQGKEKQKLEKRIAKMGLSGKVLLMGYADDISEKIANAKGFVMTSDYEGMPNALIEAMCMGLVAVATDCDGGGAKALIKNGKNGFLIKKGAVNELANVLTEIAENDFEEISKNAKKMRDELGNKKIYGKWLEYIKLVGNGGFDV